LEFCESLLLYAGLNEAKTKKMLKKVSKSINGEDQVFRVSDTISLRHRMALAWKTLFSSPKQTGISFKEFEDFFQMLRCIQDIDIALKFYYLAGTPINKGTSL
jgi:hypothetical protein